ncbi:MAG: MFS transporter [Comamonadaceae bacterium]|nr:MAG: MFS transporter [Comamonadaceae bacterium]
MGRTLFGLSIPAASLVGVNFFMADVRDGLGPYLAAFLQTHSWGTADIGTAMTLGGLVGMLATIPAGALVDATHFKRALMVLASICVAAACLLLLWRTDMAAVVIAQIAMPLAGAVIPPAIAGITLGVVGQRRLDHQLGLNEAANHAGNVFAAAASALGAWLWGIGGVLMAQIAMSMGAIAATLAVPAKSINHQQARGQNDPSQRNDSFMSLLRKRPLLLFALTMACFHLGNAAMLPMVGLQLGAQGASTGLWLSAAIIIAQLTMIPMAILAARVAQRHGYRWVVLVALLVLPVRGVIAAFLPPLWSIIPVQILDGVGAGLLGVATVGVVARIMQGTGHFNAGLAGVLTLQGLGAALSPAVGGYMAEHFGFGAGFLVLGGIALLAIPVFLNVRIDQPKG